MRSKGSSLLVFLILSRVFILVFVWLTVTLLFPESPALSFINFTADAWTRWDGLHYVYIAAHWYTNIGDPANFIVFFPLYPLLLKIFPSGVLTSSVLFVTGAYFFYELVKIDYPEKIARWSVIALAIFPTSYFFNAPYTESLFLLIFASSMYFARKEKWILAGLLTGLGCITRPFGLLLLPAILTEWYFSKNRSLKSIPIMVLPSVLTIGGYLYLNKIIYGNFFEFQKILANHWQKHFLSPVLSIEDSWRIALSGGLTNFTIMVGWAEAISITLSWILIPFAFKYLRKSWAVFYMLSIILFSSTSFILSTPRYLLSVPPFFVLIALTQKNYLFRISFRFISIGLLFCLAILFTRGQWSF